MISFDTNIVVHSANADSAVFEKARSFIESLVERDDVVICELMLAEVYLKLCNGKIFRCPMGPAEACDYCQRLRSNRNWRLVESAPVMSAVWGMSGKSGFAFRRIIDLRLGLTLRHAGVTEFATTNVKDFQNLEFGRVWNPLAAVVDG